MNSYVVKILHYTVLYKEPFYNIFKMASSPSANIGDDFYIVYEHLRLVPGRKPGVHVLPEVEEGLPPRVTPWFWTIIRCLHSIRKLGDASCTHSQRDSSNGAILDPNCSKSRGSCVHCAGKRPRNPLAVGSTLAHSTPSTDSIIRSVPKKTINYTWCPSDGILMVVISPPFVVTVPYVKAKPLEVILPLTMGGKISAPDACFIHASADDVHLKMKQ
ncbi:hypothetical protein HW555_011800 [Spodoptera exigua]|uniref:Uncharacterized protein n=1 Tax=Spodoptera exigua TaxID=7107 RepID=A0A835L088_SPOEX|nr:hypothetical protein HW555_011800 [Spodoptera exigua]